MSRPPRPDLDPGDRVLVVAHRWITSVTEHDRVHAWLPTGGYRWRTVDHVVWDTYCGWQLVCPPTAGHHPSRESAREVVAVLRHGGERRPAPIPQPEPEQLGLFELAS